MTTSGFRQTGSNSLFESLKVSIISRIEAFLFHELPQPFDQIEIGGVRWEKEDLNIQTSGNVKDILASLIPSVIHNKGDRVLQTKCSNFFKQLSNAG